MATHQNCCNCSLVHYVSVCHVNSVVSCTAPREHRKLVLDHPRAQTPVQEG